MIDSEKKAFGAWWLWVLVLVVITVAVFFGLRYFGVAGERIIFENSYQKSAADGARRSALEAELVGVETRLRAGGLTASQKADLEAQAAGLRFQLQAKD